MIVCFILCGRGCVCVCVYACLCVGSFCVCASDVCACVCGLSFLLFYEVDSLVRCAFVRGVSLSCQVREMQRFSSVSCRFDFCTGHVSSRRRLNRGGFLGCFGA